MKDLFAQQAVQPAAQPLVICPVSGQSPLEDRLNHYTHLLGLMLSLVGCVFLITWTWRYTHSRYILGASVYGSTLVMLYAVSCLYHGCAQIRQKRILRMLDHMCIYLLIAGTYTPFTLGPLSSHGGHKLLLIEWSMALIGIVCKYFTVEKFDKLSTLMYLAMGWLVLFSLPALIEKLPFDSLVWMILGGLAYSAGTVFYLKNSMRYAHVIWHLFVMMGSSCHFYSVWKMLNCLLQD